MIKRSFFDSGRAGASSSLGLLILRVLTGWLMIALHGMPKWEKVDAKKEKFPVPDILGFLSSEVALWCVIAVEIVAAGFIVLGLMTRPAAFLLCFVMGMAAFQIHGGQSLAKQELALLYFAPCLCLMFTGAGLYSIDRSIGSRS